MATAAAPCTRTVAVAKLARSYAGPEREACAATVNGAAGAVIFVAGRRSVIGA
ncbi:hypothetical protein JHV675_51770 [Mycobacterium avium subsp. hominissuis]